MVSIFLAIVCCYVLACLVVHVLHSLYRKKLSTVFHYVLVGDNHELQMEWYIRSIRWFSLLSGAQVKITVIDEGATDETPAIVRKLSRTNDDVSLKAVSNTFDSSAPAAGDAKHTLLKEPALYLWMLQEEGIVSAAEHAVVIDLRQEDQLAKLPL